MRMTSTTPMHTTRSRQTAGDIAIYTFTNRSAMPIRIFRMSIIDTVIKRG